MNIPDALTELGTHIGLPDLALNENGLCRVVFDDLLTVDFESMDEGRTLHLSAPIRTLPTQPDQAEALYAELLSGHLLGAATSGAYFSISEADDEVLFERKLEMNRLDYTSFSNALEGFINHLEAWTEKALTPSSTASASIGSFDMSHQIRA